MKDIMEALFANFAALDASVKANLEKALINIEHTYLSLFDSSVNQAIKEWKKDFGDKFPKTVEWFITSFQEDAQIFKTATIPSFLVDANVACKKKDFADAFRFSMPTGATRLESLRFVAGDEEEGDVQIQKHIEARHRLLDLFLAVEANTKVLGSLTDDDETVTYTKIVLGAGEE